MFSVLQNLYEIDAKALSSGVLISRWSEIVTAAGTAVTVTATGSKVAGDRVRVVTEISGLVISGAAQTSTAQTIQVQGNASNFLYQRIISYTAVLSRGETFGNLNYVLLPNEQLALLGTFNAGVNSNSITMYAIGYEMPRGNVM
jgi:hypothetical protein